MVRPFSGAAGSRNAPTDALRLVGAISLTAVLGGPHPHQRFTDNRSGEGCVKRALARVLNVTNASREGAKLARSIRDSLDDFFP